MNKKLRKALIWIAALSIALGLALWLGASGLNRAQEVSTSEFVEMIEQNQLTKVRIEGEQVMGERREGGGIVTTTANKTMPIIVEALNESEGEEAVNFDEEGSSRGGEWAGVMVNVLFLGLFIFIGVMIFRSFKNGAGGGGGGIFGAGGITKHKAVRMDGQTKKTFADVGGIDEVREEVKEVVAFLKNPERFAKLGGRMPKGTLLMGPPGVGKTLLAQAVAGESGVPFFSVSGSEFDEMFVGVGQARVSSLREDAEKNAPCIVYVDEIDALGNRKQAAFSGGGQEGQKTLTQFLQFMDGVERNAGIVFMGATNRPESLDSALIRPGRFDRQIHVSAPDINGREQILEIHVRNNNVPLAEDVSLALIAQMTPGFTGADLENLVNEAALVAGRLNEAALVAGRPELETVTMACFSEASDKVQMGLARKSMAMTEEEKGIICVHEMGHAVIGHLNPDSDPVQKVTCIPRGPALGVTLSAPEFDRHLPSKEWLVAKIEKSLGGRAAEEVIVGRITVGAGSDLASVRGLARAMVTRYAMSDLSPMTLGQHGQGYLGQDSFEADFSEKTAQEIDAKVCEIVDGCYKRVKETIEQHREVILVASRELEEKEVLDRDDLNRLLGPRPEGPKPFSLD